MTSVWWSVWQFLIKLNTQWFCSLLLPQEIWKHRSIQNSYTNINGNFIYNSSKLETTQMSKSRIYNISMYIWRDWGQEEKGTTEDEMAGWHHWLDGRESEWTPGVGEGQGGLVCCYSWGRKESDTTERLIWSDLIWYVQDELISETKKSDEKEHLLCESNDMMIWF